MGTPGQILDSHEIELKDKATPPSEFLMILINGMKNAEPPSKRRQYRKLYDQYGAQIKNEIEKSQRANKERVKIRADD